jgi:hypothetical protein
MRLAAKDALVSAAERAHAALDVSHQPESRAALMPPRVPAHGTVQADLGQGFIESGWFFHELISRARVRHHRTLAARAAEGEDPGIAETEPLGDELMTITGLRTRSPMPSCMARR